MRGYNRFILNTEYDAIKKVGEVTLTLSGGNFDLANGSNRTFTTETNIIPGVYFETYSTTASDTNLGGKVALTGARISLEHIEAGNNKHYDYRIFVQKGITAGKYRLSVTIYNQYGYGGTVRIPNFEITTKISLYIPASS